MHLYVPDLDRFFSWMNEKDYRYVVMRGFCEGDMRNITQSGNADIDILVDDEIVPALYSQFDRYKKEQGVRLDVHHVSGNAVFDFGSVVNRRKKKYKMFPEKTYPRKLTDMMLNRRMLWNGQFYVPCAYDWLVGLLYHITYQKPQNAGIDMADPALSSASKYAKEIQAACSASGVSFPLTLQAFHVFLKDAGYAPDLALMTRYMERYKTAHRVPFCHAVLWDDLVPGEMNLYVIRSSAVKTGTDKALLERLSAEYEILAVKPIPYFQRIIQGRYMRGNKWKRGGYPALAVVVFDPSPQVTSESDRKVHPNVFNARQFMKRDLREWFTKTTGKKSSCNPLHSTDNEAEAISHMPLFFTMDEQAKIFYDLEKRRRSLSECAV